eukprot:GHVQ01040546.1.p1 GENE.GHVQ01040546.1~~GHVQ01040546.1.p1  ORF type:complete len:1410 (-),score=157.94 GHVQ01040546.1:1914-6143(-)
MICVPPYVSVHLCVLVLCLFPPGAHMASQKLPLSDSAGTSLPSFRSVPSMTRSPECMTMLSNIAHTTVLDPSLLAYMISRGMEAISLESIIEEGRKGVIATHQVLSTESQQIKSKLTQIFRRTYRGLHTTKGRRRHSGSVERECIPRCSEKEDHGPISPNKHNILDTEETKIEKVPDARTWLPVLFFPDTGALGGGTFVEPPCDSQEPIHGKSEPPSGPADLRSEGTATSERKDSEAPIDKDTAVSSCNDSNSKMEGSSRCESTTQSSSSFYNQVLSVVRDGQVDSRLQIVRITDATHPVRFSTAPSKDCRSVIYTHSDPILTSHETPVILGEYTGNVMLASGPCQRFEYVFNLPFSSVAWSRCRNTAVKGDTGKLHQEPQSAHKGNRRKQNCLIRSIKGKSNDRHQEVKLPSDGEFVVDSSECFNEMSFVNHHSCISLLGEFKFQVNCEWRCVVVDGWPHIVLATIPGIPIASGDEIIADFGSSWFRRVEEAATSDIRSELLMYRLMHTSQHLTSSCSSRLLSTKHSGFVDNSNDSVEAGTVHSDSSTSLFRLNGAEVPGHKGRISPGGLVESYCGICKQADSHDLHLDRVICCDGCERSFHFRCLSKMTVAHRRNMENATRTKRQAASRQKSSPSSLEQQATWQQAVIEEFADSVSGAKEWFCPYCVSLAKRVVDILKRKSDRLLQNSECGRHQFLEVRKKRKVHGSTSEYNNTTTGLMRCDTASRALCRGITDETSVLDSLVEVSAGLCSSLPGVDELLDNCPRLSSALTSCKQCVKQFGDTASPIVCRLQKLHIAPSEDDDSNANYYNHTTDLDLHFGEERSCSRPNRQNKRSRVALESAGSTDTSVSLGVCISIIDALYHQVRVCKRRVKKLEAQIMKQRAGASDLSTTTSGSMSHDSENGTSSGSAVCDARSGVAFGPYADTTVCSTISTSNIILVPRNRVSLSCDRFATTRRCPPSPKKLRRSLTGSTDAQPRIETPGVGLPTTTEPAQALSGSVGHEMSTATSSCHVPIWGINLGSTAMSKSLRLRGLSGVVGKYYEASRAGADVEGNYCVEVLPRESRHRESGVLELRKADCVLQVFCQHVKCSTSEVMLRIQEGGTKTCMIPCAVGCADGLCEICYFDTPALGQGTSAQAASAISYLHSSKNFPLLYVHNRKRSPVPEKVTKSRQSRQSSVVPPTAQNGLETGESLINNESKSQQEKSKEGEWLRADTLMIDLLTDACQPASNHVNNLADLLHPKLRRFIKHCPGKKYVGAQNVRGKNDAGTNTWDIKNGETEVKTDPDMSPSSSLSSELNIPVSRTPDSANANEVVESTGDDACSVADDVVEQQVATSQDCQQHRHSDIGTAGDCEKGLDIPAVVITVATTGKTKYDNSDEPTTKYDNCDNPTNIPLEKHTVHFHWSD